MSQYKILVVDFETYYDDEYSLKYMLPMDYVADERFKIHNCSFKYGTGDTFVLHGSELDDYMEEIDWRYVSLLAHNMWFDGEIVVHHYGKRPRSYIDTMMLAQMRVGLIIGSASLENVARYYGLGGKTAGTLASVKGVRDLSPEQLALLNIYAKRDALLEWKIFEKMNKDLSCTELEVIDLHCRMVLDRVVEIDPVHLNKSLKTLESTKNEVYEELARWYEEPVEDVPELLRKNEWYAGKLTEAGATPPTRKSPTNDEKRIFDFRKDSLAFTSLRAHSEETDALVTARLHAKSNTVETRIRTLLKVSKDGTRPIPVPLKYAGARTLRSSGTWSMNMQNLKGGNEIRPGVVAPDGKMFVVGDSSQVEVRKNAWFCGHAKLLKVFAENGDPYLWQAEELYKRRLTKEDNPKERFLGKTVVLGFGYGMGRTRAHQTFLSKRIEISYAETEEIVDRYRSSNRPIVRMWGTVERALFRARQLHTTVQVGCVTFWYNEKTNIGGIHLPNGTDIFYPRLSYDEETGQLYYFANMKSDTEITLWGGKILENIIQALARIVVYLQALVVDKSWQIVLLVHDEIVLCVDEDKAEAAQNELDKALAWTPPGFEGLPLAGESVICKQYEKP